VVNPSGFVGSIGIYGVLYDYSAMFAEDGVKALVFRSGKFKGIGTDGEEISEEQQAELQRDVEAVHALFVRAVAAGRRISTSQAAKLADGRVYLVWQR